MDAGNLSKEIRRILKQKGFPLIHLHNCDRDLFSFFKSLDAAINQNDFGPFVDKHSPKELKESGAIAFLSRDKMSGVAVWPDGNIRAVFKNTNSKIKGSASGELILTALSAGGNKLDCFDGRLRIIYSKFGFIPVARVKFNPEYAPKNWRNEFGTPDIVFWVHCGESVEAVARKISNYPKYTDSDIQQLPCFDSYDVAYDYRDNILDEMRNEKQEKKAGTKL